jgi:hypothetical protein
MRTAGQLLCRKPNISVDPAALFASIQFGVGRNYTFSFVEVK